MPFEGPKAKASTTTTRPTPSQSSALEDGLEGKLLDDIEFGPSTTAATSKSSKKTGKDTKPPPGPKPKTFLKARAESRKPTAPTSPASKKSPESKVNTKAKVKVPSLPSSSPPPPLSHNDDGGESQVQSKIAKPTPELKSVKKKEEKVSVRAQPSFDMDAILNSTKSKPPVVYKKKSPPVHDSQDQDEEEEEAGDQGSLPPSEAGEESGSRKYWNWKRTDSQEEKEKAEEEVESQIKPNAKSKQASKTDPKSKLTTTTSKSKSKSKSKAKAAVPRLVVEMPTRKLSSRAQPKKSDHQVELKDQEDEAESKVEKVMDEDQEAAIENNEPTKPIEEEEVLATIDQPSSPVAAASDPEPIVEASSAGRPTRTAKSRGTKRLTEYNLDEIDPDSGGSAGVVLDEMMAGPTKKSKKSRPPPTSTKSSTTKAESKAISTDELEQLVDEPQVDGPEHPAASELEHGDDLKMEVEVNELAGDDDQEEDMQRVPTKEVEAEAVTPIDIAPKSSTKSTKPTDIEKSVPPTKIDATPKPKARKSINKAEKAIPSTPGLENDTPAINLDKDLVIRMIVAKLESSKNCDWYDLASQLNKDGLGGRLGVGKKGKKGKKGTTEDKDKVTGDQLYELYHQVSSSSS